MADTDQITVEVGEFLDKYFGDIAKVVEFEEKFLEENGLDATTIDYFKLRRFLETAVRNLKAIDQNLLTGLVSKLYKDVTSLFDYYAKEKSRISMGTIVFDRDFLPSVKAYHVLTDEIEKTKTIQGTYETKMRYYDNLIKELEANTTISAADKQREHKKLKLNYVDAVHHYAQARDRLPQLFVELEDLTNAYRECFLENFESYKSYYLEHLAAVVNTKAYYLDKLLWHNAQQSRDITRFFKDAGIRGGYDTKTFINYYLKNIDQKKTFDQGWHTYLKECLGMLE